MIFIENIVHFSGPKYFYSVMSKVCGGFRGFLAGILAFRVKAKTLSSASPATVRRKYHKIRG